MWRILAPRIRPDVHVWPGRRLVSAVDAVVWPLAVAAWIATVSLDTGMVGVVGMACCGLFAVRRLVRAVSSNERYRITTVCLFRPLAPLLMLGAMLQIGRLVAGG